MDEPPLWDGPSSRLAGGTFSRGAPYVGGANARCQQGDRLVEPTRNAARANIAQRPPDRQQYDLARI